MAKQNTQTANVCFHLHTTQQMGNHFDDVHVSKKNQN